MPPSSPRPGKIICVAQNYKAHIAEQGIKPPAYPTLFAKFSSALAGARDEIVLPVDSNQVDWEVELAVVIGSPAFRASEEEALAAVGGYAVLNDVSMRDWQYRTSQFCRGRPSTRPRRLAPGLSLETTPQWTSGACTCPARSTGT